MVFLYYSLVIDNISVKISEILQLSTGDIMVIQDATAARHNLQILLDGGEFKDRILKTLDTLQNNKQLNEFAAEDQKKLARKESFKSFFKKAGGLVVGGGLIVAGGALTITAVTAAIPAALAVGALTAAGGALVYGKTISNMMSPNAKLHHTNNKVERAEHDASIAGVNFSDISKLAMDAQLAVMQKSPDAKDKMNALQEKIASVEAAQSYIDASNQRSMEDMRMKDPNKKTFGEKLGNALKKKTVEVVKHDITKGFKPH